MVVYHGNLLIMYMHQREIFAFEICLKLFIFAVNFLSGMFNYDNIYNTFMKQDGS